MKSVESVAVFRVLISSIAIKMFIILFCQMSLINSMLTDIVLMRKKKRSNFLKIFVDGGEIVLYKNLHAMSVRSF